LNFHKHGYAKVKSCISSNVYVWCSLDTFSLSSNKRRKFRSWYSVFIKRGFCLLYSICQT